jgi:MerR family transcriptional regulator, copper efflux regulator
MHKPLTIGQVARLCDLGVETVRFYEREGLIEPPPRKASGYRQYPQETVSRLRFVRRAKDLGFSLQEIRELLALRDNPAASAREVKRRAEDKLADIEARLADLERMRTALLGLTQSCHGRGSVVTCPIIEALNRGDEPPATTAPTPRESADPLDRSSRGRTLTRGVSS